MRLKLGTYYKSKDGAIWCCFKHAGQLGEHAEFYCIRLDDFRVEYFYRDGRYDSEGNREHTLIEEVPPPELKRASERPCPVCRGISNTECANCNSTGRVKIKKD